MIRLETNINIYQQSKSERQRIEEVLKTVPPEERSFDQVFSPLGGCFKYYLSVLAVKDDDLCQQALQLMKEEHEDKALRLAEKELNELMVQLKEIKGE